MIKQSKLYFEIFQFLNLFKCQIISINFIIFYYYIQLYYITYFFIFIITGTKVHLNQNTLNKYRKESFRFSEEMISFRKKCNNHFQKQSNYFHGRPILLRVRYSSSFARLLCQMAFRATG